MNNNWTDDELAEIVKAVVEALNDWLEVCAQAGLEVTLNNYGVTRLGDAATRPYFVATVKKVL